MSTTSNLRSDGLAVDVVIPTGKSVTKGDLVYIQGWHGVAMTTGVAGDTISIETTVREFSFVIGSTVAAKGDVLYLPLTSGFGQHTGNGGATGLSATNTGRPVVKVTKAKDGNNVIWAKLLPNTTA